MNKEKLTRFEYDLLKYLKTRGFIRIQRYHGDIVFIKDSNYSSYPDIFEDLFTTVVEEHQVGSIESILNNCEVID